MLENLSRHDNDSWLTAEMGGDRRWASLLAWLLAAVMGGWLAQVEVRDSGGLILVEDHQRGVIGRVRHLRG